MKMPGFSAEAALRERSGQLWSATPVRATASAVVPARPCCSGCDNVCDHNPESPWCIKCYDNCIDC
jgi:hypothetical protein